MKCFRCGIWSLVTHYWSTKPINSAVRKQKLTQCWPLAESWAYSFGIRGWGFTCMHCTSGYACEWWCCVSLPYSDEEGCSDNSWDGNIAVSVIQPYFCFSCTCQREEAACQNEHTYLLQHTVNTDGPTCVFHRIRRYIKHNNDLFYQKLQWSSDYTVVVDAWWIKSGGIW